MSYKWTANTTSGEIVPANAMRGELIIQNYGPDPANLAFLGRDAEDDEGVRLYPGSTVTVTGAKARGAVNAITETGTAAGGWE